MPVSINWFSGSSRRSPDHGSPSQGAGLDDGSGQSTSPVSGSVTTESVTASPFFDDSLGLSRSTSRSLLSPGELARHSDKESAPAAEPESTSTSTKRFVSIFDAFHEEEKIAYKAVGGPIKGDVSDVRSAPNQVGNDCDPARYHGKHPYAARPGGVVEQKNSVDDDNHAAGFANLDASMVMFADEFDRELDEVFNTARQRDVSVTQFHSLPPWLADKDIILSSLNPHYISVSRLADELEISTQVGNGYDYNPACYNDEHLYAPGDVFEKKNSVVVDAAGFAAVDASMATFADEFERDLDEVFNTTRRCHISVTQHGLPTPAADKDIVLSPLDPHYISVSCLADELERELDELLEWKLIALFFANQAKDNISPFILPTAAGEGPCFEGNPGLILPESLIGTLVI